MPVRIEDFEEGNLPQGPSVPEQVITYLYTNRNKAFTRSEIATGIDEEPNTVGTALSRLKQRNLVRHRGEYWAITEDLDRVSDAYELHSITERLDENDGGIDSAEWDAETPDEPHPSERAESGNE
jgi:Mn-dependent DtxR family transcriptional regulator